MQNNMSNIQMNQLAMKILKSLGNKRPTDEQMHLAVRLVQTASVQLQFSFDKRLSVSEINCLYLAAKGLTALEMAKLMEVKSTTIVTHKRNILKKLSCKTIAQAVFEGIRFSYISPEFRHFDKYYGKIEVTQKGEMDSLDENEKHHDI